MNTSLVSVIVPAYNHEKYVRQTIQSIIDQDYANIELLIVDDGSKDSTFSLVQSMRSACEQRFVRFVCETQTNQGTCATFNRLLAMARGEYIYVIASDDVSKPNAISILLNEFQSEDIVLAVGDNEFIDGTGTRVGWKQCYETAPLEEAKYKTFVECFRQLYGGCYDRFGEYETFLQGNYIPNGYLIRKSALVQIGGFAKDAPLEDHYMHLQLSKIGKYRFVDTVLFSYRWHGNNTAQQHDKMLQLQAKTLRCEEFLLAKKYPERLPLFERHWVLINRQKLETYERWGKKYRKYQKKYHFLLVVVLFLILLIGIMLGLKCI